MTEDDTLLREDPDFRAGYDDMMVMHRLAERRGWRVPPRIIAREMLRLERGATQPRGAHDVPLLEQRLYAPNWYRGRAAALREILRLMRGGD